MSLFKKKQILVIFNPVDQFNKMVNKISKMIEKRIIETEKDKKNVSEFWEMIQQG